MVSKRSVSTWAYCFSEGSENCTRVCSMTSLVMASVNVVASPDEVLSARRVAGQIYIDDKIRDYIVDVVHSTRDPREFGLHELAPLLAPAVDDLHLCVDQAAAPVVGVGADQLRLASRELDIAIAEAVREQRERRRDAMSTRVLDDEEVLCAHRRMATVRQIRGPVRDLAVDGGWRFRVDDRVEGRQGFGVGGRSAPQYQSVAQVADQLAARKWPRRWDAVE